MSTRTAPQDVAGVVAAQQVWSDPTLINDADVIADQLRSDGVLVTPNGIVSADQVLAAIRTSALSHTRMEAAQDPDGDPRVRVYGNTAVLTQRVVSTEVTLQPGDLMSSGTCGGTGMGRTPQEFMHPGDTVTVGVTGVGYLTNPLEAGGNQPC